LFPKTNEMIKLLLYRKRERVNNPSAFKLNGPKGIVTNISPKGDIYVKGRCIYANIPDEYKVRLEVDNIYLINKPLTVVIKERHHIRQLLDICEYDYFNPILSNNHYLIKRIPKYFTLSVNKGIPRLPKTGFSITNTNPNPNQSELIVDLIEDSTLKGEHLFHLPSLS